MPSDEGSAAGAAALRRSATRRAALGAKWAQTTDSLTASKKSERAEGVPELTLDSVERS